jgi:hypothetical protein
MYHAGGRVPQSPMEGLTPASADDLPPLGEPLVDDAFWQYPAWGLAREGAGHLRVWATAAASPGYLAVVTETGGLTSVTESAGRIWAGLARRYGPCLVLLEHHPAPESGEGMETWTWSASALTGARTGPGYGRPRSRTRVTPGWNGGWPLTGTRSSAGPRAGSTGGTTLTADCSWRPRDVGSRCAAPSESLRTGILRSDVAQGDLDRCCCCGSAPDLPHAAPGCVFVSIC